VMIVSAAIHAIIAFVKVFFISTPSYPFMNTGWFGVAVFLQLNVSNMNIRFDVISSSIHINNIYIEIQNNSFVAYKK